MRHIIIEGMDGSGKTTLLQQIRGTRYGSQFVLHARASTSIGGPVPDLADWVDNDLDFIQHRYGTPFIYDRHPLISELLYADLRKVNRGLSGNFTDVNWIVKSQRVMAHRSILIICQPPYSIVDQALHVTGREGHMPGVFENRHTLYSRYEKFVWPGAVIRYDWTHDRVDELIDILSHINKPKVAK